MRLVFFSLWIAASLVAKQLEVEVGARSAILMNAATGAVLFEKHAHVPAPPASTTKIATALFILDKGIDLEKKATVSSECLKMKPLKNRDQYPAHWLESDGTMMDLKRGEILSFETLLHGLMLISGNDAANVIAESVAGSVPKFMEMLNEYLQGLGCKNTQFRNPHGLPHPEHWSSAYDLALMTKRALQIPTFRKLVSTPIYVKPKTNKQPPCELKTFNNLLKPNSRYYYSKAIGVKTGYTEASQYTLVAAAEHEGRTLIAVLLGDEKKADRYEDARRLFETAFAEEKNSRHLAGPENLFVKEIPGSKTALKAALAKPLAIEFFPSEEPKCKAALHWNLRRLPIRKGEKVGEVRICDETGAVLQTGDLLALEEVKGSFFFILKERIAQLFR